jgi:alpha-galactosidase
MVTNTVRRVYANVPNEGIIENLPRGGPVEVPCLVDENGVQPVTIGAIPPQLAALMQTNINVQALTVEAALTGKKEYIYQAAMLDPHTGSELTLDQIWAMVDELVEAHGEWLPEYH